MLMVDIGTSWSPTSGDMQSSFPNTFFSAGHNRLLPEVSALVVYPAAVRITSCCYSAVEYRRHEDQEKVARPEELWSRMSLG